MNTPRYSLRDIFGFLHEATALLEAKTVTVVDDDNVKTEMTLRDFVGMAMAHELTSETSKMAGGDMATKEEVTEAMKANHYDDVAFPVYEYFGLIMSGGRKARNTRKHRRN